MELIVAMGVSCILTAVAAMHYSDLEGGFHRFDARAHLLEDIKTAQAFTLAQGCRGIFRFASDGKSYTFGCDYLDYDVTDPPAADSIEFTRTLGGDVTIDASDTVILNSRGQTVDKDDVLINITFELRSKKEGSSPEAFASGQLLATGIFSYD